MEPEVMTPHTQQSSIQQNFPKIDSNYSFLTNKYQSIFLPRANTEKISIHVVGYQTERFFMKQTLIFKIQVTDKKTDEIWIIKRKYCDVLWFHEALTINYTGYIIPFFPSKQTQSNQVLIQKFGLHFEDNNKQEIGNERISLISSFLNQIYDHNQLRYTEQAEIFINKDLKQFYSKKENVQQIVEEWKDLETQTSTFLNLFQKGSSFIFNYLGGIQEISRKRSEQDIEFEMFEAKAALDKDNIVKLCNSFKELVSLKQQQANSPQLTGQWNEIDSMNAKLDLSKNYNLDFARTAKLKVIRFLTRLQSWIIQVHFKLIHRRQLVNLYQSLQQNIDDMNRINRLKRRIKTFETNFKKSYPTFKQISLAKQNKISQAFKQVWKQHSKDMQMIWK